MTKISRKGKFAITTAIILTALGLGMFAADKAYKIKNQVNIKADFNPQEIFIEDPYNCFDEATIKDVIASKSDFIPGQKKHNGFCSGYSQAILMKMLGNNFFDNHPYLSEIKNIFKNFNYPANKDFDTRKIGILGDAWETFYNIQNKGGNVILFDKDNENSFQKNANVINKNAQLGDIVCFYYANSNFNDVAKTNGAGFTHEGVVIGFQKTKDTKKAIIAHLFNGHAYGISDPVSRYETLSQIGSNLIFSSYADTTGFDQPKHDFKEGEALIFPKGLLRPNYRLLQFLKDENINEEKDIYYLIDSIEEEFSFVNNNRQELSEFTVCIDNILNENNFSIEENPNLISLFLAYSVQESGIRNIPPLMRNLNLGKLTLEKETDNTTGYFEKDVRHIAVKYFNNSIKDAKNALQSLPKGVDIPFQEYVSIISAYSQSNSPKKWESFLENENNRAIISSAMNIYPGAPIVAAMQKRLGIKYVDGNFLYLKQNNIVNQDGTVTHINNSGTKRKMNKTETETYLIQILTENNKEFKYSRQEMMDLYYNVDVFFKSNVYKVFFGNRIIHYAFPKNASALNNKGIKASIGKMFGETSNIIDYKNAIDAEFEVIKDLTN